MTSLLWRGNMASMWSDSMTSYFFLSFIHSCPHTSTSFLHSFIRSLTPVLRFFIYAFVPSHQYSLHPFILSIIHSLTQVLPSFLLYFPHTGSSSFLLSHQSFLLFLPSHQSLLPSFLLFLSPVPPYFTRSLIVSSPSIHHSFASDFIRNNTVVPSFLRSSHTPVLASSLHAFVPTH